MRLRNWLAFATGMVVALAAAYAAYSLANYSWAQVVGYRSPYAKAALPEGQVPAAPARRGSARPLLVLVIVDGLREDVSRTMPTLNALRARGYDAVVRTYQPSLSYPNWTDLLSGAPQRISGVTTNWFDRRVPVETLVDMTIRSGRSFVAVGPTVLARLYDVKGPYSRTFLRNWVKGTYLSGEMADEAIAMEKDLKKGMLLVHFPDVDEAGHASGGASKQYASMALRVDGEIAKLVDAFDASSTTFIVTSDHGHIDAGGHGGWESVVTEVPAVFAGPGIAVGAGRGTQDQVAPTIAMLSALPVPRNATGEPLAVLKVLPPDTGRFGTQEVGAFNAYRQVVEPSAAPAATIALDARAAFDRATRDRLAAERTGRLPMALGLAAACLLALAAVGLLSWRALVSALAGTIGYYVVYDGLYFVVHRYQWSLSALNSESMVKAFFNARMIEAAAAGVVAAIVAAEVYRATRKEPQPPKGEYLPGWLALGVATVIAIQATLGLQIAWYLWAWGANVTWVLPNFEWAFKYDLDLIQMTALAAVAVLAPLAAFLIGQYHPVRPTKG